MIERWLKNELSIKRWRYFKSSKRAAFSLAGIIVIVFFSITAEFWANSKPILLHYHGRTFIPFAFQYHPLEFGREDILQMDYKNLKLDSGDWAWWPAVRWDPFESNKAVANFPSEPTRENILGTDQSGR